MKTVKANVVPTRKRSAPGPKANSKATSVGPQPQVKTSSRRDNKRGLKKGSVSALVRGSKGSVTPEASNLSFDMDSQILGIEEFPQNVRGMSPLDLTNSPNLTTAHFPNQESHLQHGLIEDMNQLNRLDAMMFPSEDPLEYPNQPIIGLGHQHTSQSASPGGSDQHDLAQFYMPNLFDGIEGHLMGPLPPYLTQTPGQQGFMFPSQMYSDPMLDVQMQNPQMRCDPQQVQLDMHSQTQQQQQRRQQRGFNQFSNPGWSGPFHYG
jgi:hypothetical protein